MEEAQGIMKLCDQLNEERTQLQNVSSLQVNGYTFRVSAIVIFA